MRHRKQFVANGEENDIPSWRENGDSKMNLKLTTEQKKQLEILLEKFQDVVIYEQTWKDQSHQTFHTHHQHHFREAAILLVGS